MRSRTTLLHVLALGAELALAGLIGFLLLVLAWAHNVRFDLTPTKENTLSDQAQRTARRLDSDVAITVFYSSQDQARVHDIKELLRRFGEQSRHVHFKMYDLDRSPLMADHLGVVNYNAGVIEGYGRKLAVRDTTEAELTTDLIRLIEGEERVALFTVGHGEHDPNSSDPRSGLSQVAKGLEIENYRVERSNDLRGGIPDEVALLVVANPTSDFTEGEIEAVRRYLRAGGGALFLVEAGAPKRFQALLREFGLECGNDLIVDERNRLFFADSFAPQVALFNDEIMPPTGAPPALLALAQSIRVIDPSEPGFRVAPLAFTGEDTWADVDRLSVEGRAPVFRRGIDQPGPIAVAAIARGEGSADKRGSIVAVGDAEFATNLYVGSLGNRDLFLNLAHLAARAESLISVRAEGTPGGTFSRLYLTARQARVLFWLGVVALPGSVLLLGALVGWRRRARSAG